MWACAGKYCLLLPRDVGLVWAFRLQWRLVRLVVPNCIAAYRCVMAIAVTHQTYRSTLSPKMKRAWIHSIRRDPGKHFQITPSLRVCGNHFRPEDIYETPSGRRRLHRNSVPSKFSWTKLIAERPLPNRLRTTDDATVPSSRTSSLSFNQINPTQVDHNYCIVVKTAEEKLEQALKEIENLKTQVSKLSISKFGMERFKASSSMIKYYTGFSSYCLLIDFFHILLDCANSLTLWSAVSEEVYNGSSDFLDHPCKKRSLPLADELFLFLCRLRQGFDEIHLSDVFCISQSTVSRIVITWANFLYFTLASIPIWPTREQVYENMPQCFKNQGYGSTRIVLDCCEILCQSPSSLMLQSEFFSFYKNHTTLKCLLGIAPHGPITFVSSLFCGSISDSEITRRSGILSLLERGDSVMCDKGFAIRSLLEVKGVGLNIPPFNFNGRFTYEEALRSSKIASLKSPRRTSNQKGERISEYH
uniref:uncharacterized protein LOC120346532 n=1 Tax=Styela clava TaxID=7725 RepID=UPI001939385E|nr:uncharacterized protein LOC120346532 [Styela clava]